MSKVEKEQTNKLIDKYICSNNISHMFFLVDIRHLPTNNDKLMYDWLVAHGINFTIIANKADKIAKTKIDQHLLDITKGLFAKEEIIPFSSQTKLNLDKIETVITDHLAN